MNETVTIILPLPNPYLSPNKPPGSRGGRMKKVAIVKKYRRQAKEETEANGVTGWKKANLKAVFFHKQKRRRDSLNFMSMLKSAIDGIVDAKLIPDDDSEILTPLPPEFKIDEKFSRVEITLERTG